MRYKRRPEPISKHDLKEKEKIEAKPEVKINESKVTNLIETESKSLDQQDLDNHAIEKLDDLIHTTMYISNQQGKNASPQSNTSISPTRFHEDNLLEFESNASNEQNFPAHPSNDPQTDATLQSSSKSGESEPTSKKNMKKSLAGNINVSRSFLILTFLRVYPHLLISLRNFLLRVRAKIRPSLN